MGQEQLVYDVLLPHVGTPRLLLVPAEGGWALPRFVSREMHLGLVEHINEAVQSRFGLEVTVLRCLGQETMEGGIYRVYALENHSPPGVTPAEGRWIEHAELANLPLAFPEQRPWLETWFVEAETGDVPPQRVPWARPGWYAEASAWITKQLAHLNLVLNGPLVQQRSWATSCVLKADTPGGDIYFKAVSAPFAHEPPLLAALAAWYPTHLPPILAVDRERGWLLTGDVGDVVLDKVTELVRWEEALAAFAELQIGLVKKREHLVALGCPERRLETLATQLSTLLAEWRGPTFARSQVSSLALLCEELASCGVPGTLEHGDFWPGNIFLSDERYIYLDWSNSSLAHPFFSLASFFYYIDNYRPDLPPEVFVRLREAYLAPWTIFASRERLQRAFSLALVLAGLHHAITYQSYILPQLEPEARWEVAMAVPYYIQQTLRHKATVI